VLDATGAWAWKEVPKRMLMLVIEMGADAVDIGMAAKVAHGSCAYLPPARK
jgi:hypothetical protein